MATQTRQIKSKREMDMIYGNQGKHHIFYWNSATYISDGMLCLEFFTQIIFIMSVSFQKKYTLDQYICSQRENKWSGKKNTAKTKYTKAGRYLV